MKTIYRWPAYVLLLAWIFIPVLVLVTVGLPLQRVGFEYARPATEIVYGLIFIFIYLGYPLNTTVQLSRRYKTVSRRVWLPSAISLAVFGLLLVLKYVLLAVGFSGNWDPQLFAAAFLLVGFSSLFCLFGCAAHSIVLAERERYGMRQSRTPLVFWFLFQLIGVFFIHPRIRRLLET